MTPRLSLSTAVALLPENVVDMGQRRYDRWIQAAVIASPLMSAAAWINSATVGRILTVFTVLPSTLQTARKRGSESRRSSLHGKDASPRLR